MIDSVRNYKICLCLSFMAFSLPITQLVGRAAYNSFLTFSFVFLIYFLVKTKIDVDSRTKIFFVLIVFSIFLSVWIGDETWRSFRKFLKYSVGISFFWLFFYGIKEKILRADSVFGYLTFVLGVVCTIFMIRGAWENGLSTPFLSRGLFESNIPFLTVCSFFYLLYSFNPRYRGVALLGCFSIVFFLLLVSGGRSSLVAFLAGGIVFALTVFRVNWRALAAVFGILCVGLFLALGPAFFRVDENAGGSSRHIDNISNGRTNLWENAIHDPPDSLLRGVGIGNLRYQDKVLDIVWGDKVVRVKHLHNFILDMWYETGFLGVGALLLFLVWVLVKSWPDAIGIPYAKEQMALFSAIVCLLVGGSLSFSYSSPQMTVYLFSLLGLMAGLNDLRISEVRKEMA